MLLTCFYSKIEFDKTLEHNLFFVSGYLKAIPSHRVFVYMVMDSVGLLT